MFIHIIPDVTR